MIDTMHRLDAAIPLDAKLAPLAHDLRGLIKSRWGDMERQERLLLESSLSGIERAAGLIKERNDAFAARRAKRG